MNRGDLFAAMRERLPAGRRLRLAIAGVIAVGTTIPLALSSPGGPGPSFLRVTANPTTDTTYATTTTTTSPAEVAVTAPTTAPPVRTGTASASVRPVASPVRTTIDTGTTRPVPTTQPPVTAPPAEVTVAGPPTACVVPDVTLAVTTDRAGYQPGDTVQITVAASNRGTRACLLADGPSTNLPVDQCQAESLVEAPWTASLPNVYEVMADIAPHCSGTVHLLGPGDTWRTTVPVIIPGDGTWPPGAYNIHSEWQTSTLFLSAETPFSLGAGAVTTLPPTTTTTMSVAGPNDPPTTLP